MTMRDYISGFPGQVEEAYKIAQDFNAANKISKEGISNILITGLGGSGISGTLIAELTADFSDVPVLVNKDYSLPVYANASTLLLVCSYSGNTEETIAVLKKAVEKKCKVVCISSGGEVSAIAAANKFPLVKIPGGHPPRASFGYPFVQLLNIFDQLGFLEKGYGNQLSAFVSFAKSNAGTIEDESKLMAQKLFGKIPVIYSISGNEGAAIRFRQQINENSKMLCWHHVLPEMNHNELVGWVEKNENLAVIAFRINSDYERSVKRLEICKEIIEPLVSSFSVLEGKGNSQLEEVLYLIHFTDWVSLHLADMKKIDPVEVNVITRLKNELSKF